MQERRIWARGLTASDRGKIVSGLNSDGFYQTALIQSVENLDNSTIVTVTSQIDFDSDREIIVYD